MACIPFHQHPQREAILARMHAMAGAVMARSQREGKAWAKFIDPDAALAIFAHLSEHESFAGELRAVIANDSHLLVYVVSPMWFAPAHPLLVEQFFLRVGHGAQHLAMEAIERLGRDLGARGVLMATMLMPNEEAGERLFRQHGYSRQCSQHFKELN